MNLRVLTDVKPWYVRILAAPAPLSVYEALYASERHGFLYESLEGHGTQGRFSFLGGRPRVILKSKQDHIEVSTPGGDHTLRGNPLRILRDLVRSGRDALPVATFPGGGVGYLSYDIIRFIERIPDDNPDDLDLPDAYFLFPEEIVIIDHLDEVVHILLYVEENQRTRAEEIESVIRSCDAKSHGGDRQARDCASKSVSTTSPIPDIGPPTPPHPEMSREQYCAAVHRAKEYIRSGDIFQVVLAQRFQFPLSGSPLDLYKALRITNPSPYMYFLNLDGVTISGSSPEILVKLTGRRVVTRPLAGTRPRGATLEEDDALAQELQADEKERAEHVMLVDLARNDIGRVCRPGSVAVTNLLDVERYARVMHLVSDVEGRLRDDCDAFDLFESTFPAGTVSGAPKIRAMEIIDELEPTRRGPYAGAIGYFSFLGDMDVCIAIRTIITSGDTGYIQAGAGIVADSDPDKEYQETLNKAAGLFRAVELAKSMPS